MKTMKKIVAILAVALMLCSILPLSVFAADTYELASSIEVGDTVVLVCKEKSMELNGISTTSTKYGLGVAYTGAPVGAYALTVEEGYTAGTYSFKCPNGQYLYWTSGNSLNTNATKNANTSWNVSFSGDNAVITNAKDSARKLQWNASSPRFACYTGSQTAIQLYKLSGGEEPPVTCEHVWVDADCTTPKTCSLCSETEGEALGHSYGEATETVAPDCTNAGEQQSTCSVCGDVKTETVTALGHNYVDGICSVCGEELPLEATIDFSTTGQRTEYSTSTQKWENDGLTLINNKASSTTNIGDYSNPARFYKSTQIIVSFPGMTSLVINATGIESKYLWEATLDATGLTYTVSEQVYTITFAEPTDSITLTAANQVRANSITAYGAGASPCEHDYVGVETQAPSCTVEGVTTYTCSKCGESYTEAIATVPHNYGEGVETQAPDCTNAGVKTYTCTVCGDVKTEDIPANGHNYVDDICDICGAVKAYKGTIDFSTNDQRTEYSTSTQKWESEGLTLINNKASATTNIGDYSNPARFYKSTQIIISFPEMSKLIIDASGIGSSYLWEASLDAAGLTYTVSDQIYTITFAEPVNSLELTAANQVRANSITAVVAHEHVYDNDFDTDCNKCGEVRAVVAPIAKNGFSVSEDVSGLAVRFTATLEGMGIDDTTAIYDNAMLNGYKVISMGAIVTNGISTIDVPAVYLCDDDVSTGAQYAIRIKNIPADKYDVEITFTPYIIVEIDGVATTIEGEAVVGSYAEIAG